MESLQVVAFRLNDSLFATDIMKVREIMRMTPVTKLPAAPPFMLGVINVRGKITPVIDTRIKLGVESKEASEHSRLLLVERNGHPIGLLVDEVTEVLTIDRDQLETVDDLGLSVEYVGSIIGVAKLKDRLLTILDTDLLL